MILFDVGANFGKDSLERTRHDKSITCYAFEPTPELVNHLHHLSADIRDRYFINKTAVSDFDGFANFNIAAHCDWGTSSLLKFNDGLNVTWPGRPDFFVDRIEEVAVTRLDTWFEKHQPNIDKIDFFHCDTQGSDLAVLKGMGKYLQLIIEGVVEVPQNDKVKLYAGQFSKNEMEEFLNDNGYEIYKVDSQQNEDNLYFRKKGCSG